MPRLGEQLERTDPGFPWFVGFERLTLDELDDIRCDLLERLDEPEFLRDGDDDAYESWVEQINDEIQGREAKKI